MACRLFGAKPLTNTDLLLIGPIATNFSQIRIKIQSFSFMTIDLKMSSAKCHPFVQGEMHDI